ncbi:hypothetical protein Egran_04789 [Elaphomyces granulatus]|uniref:PNPLA domain-containing protein n=1 Tax=Elaphomyces granulatus TaxID=519963 RepID=A0A232LUD1_9EURO|nr:hypothetical protein Egran_04789 [Elaphomyces granulatus]
MRRFVSALAQALDETSNNPRRGRGHDPIRIYLMSLGKEAPLNPQVQSNPYLAVLEPPQTSPFIGQPSDELVHRPYATASSYADDDSDSDENVTLPIRAVSTSPYPRHHPSRSNQSANPITSLRPVSASALSQAPNLSPESVSSVHRDFRSENPGKPALRKILSLDGGGVRGLSTILILKSLMYYLGRQRGKKLEPWQEFDLIGGTSTGGLLAIMLGRLRMSLDDCEAAYLNISRRIFQPIRHRANKIGQAVDFLQANGKFDAAKLEDCIKEILAELKMDQDMLLKEDDDKACKVFVCAVTGYESTAVIRSYDIGRYDQLFDICRIWEAARATSAASTLFDPITIGPYKRKFVDGALRHNNPINLVDLEVSDLWPDDEKLIISVGTGSGPGGSVTGNLEDLIQTLKRIATDTEEKNNMFRLQHPQMVANDRLFRFNVYHGLSQVGLAEHEAVDRIADFTQQYLDQEETRSGIKKCVTSMITGGQRLNIAGQQG